MKTISGYAPMELAKQLYNNGELAIQCYEFICYDELNCIVECIKDNKYLYTENVYSISGISTLIKETIYNK